MKINNIFWVVFALIIIVSVFLAGYKSGKTRGYKKAKTECTVMSGPIHRVESTIEVEPLVFTKIKEKEVYVRDSIFIPIKDTDTIYVSVPREYKVYQDTSFRAVVSGYSPSLDSLTIYRTKIIQTVTLKPKPYKWSIGVHAGYGVSAHNGTLMLAPHIGVGVSYNFIRF